MRVLIVDPIRTERESTLRLVPTDAHEVKVACDASGALSLLDKTGFDVLLIEATMTGVSGVELVKRIRARESSEHVYIIVTAARPLPGDLKAAFLAGADDFIRKPMPRDELLARIDGPVRIRRWAAKSIPGASDDFEKRSELTTISAWTSVDSSVCSEVSDMLGMSLAPSPSTNALDGAINVAMLPLSLSSEMTEVCLAVGIDDVSAAALSESMFGATSPEPEMVKDMLREIANVAAGAFKRVAASEGRTFTTGLPTDTTATAFRSSAALARRQWIGTPEGSSMCLRFEIVIRPRPPKRVRVSSLREGMVVANDLHTSSGALLMRAGTRITESHLGGLNNSLGREAPVEVLEAA